MSSETVTVKIEGQNELQSYFKSFEKEVEADDDSIIIPVETEEDEDGGGSYYVDQSGNYYYQASKASEPVLANPPTELSEYTIAEVDDLNELDEEIYESKFSERIKNQKSESPSHCVVIMNDTENQKDSTSRKEEIYDFNETEIPKDIKEKTKIKVIQLLTKKPPPLEALHQCTHCSYTTTKRYLLARHFKSHSDERPFKCSVCERGFKTNSSLQNHVNTHTGHKPYRCSYCESCFSTSGELVRHVRYRHTHEKPHKCTECDYASVELSKLKRHIRCHTGERPYQCPHCTYASPDTFKLKRHLRIHTGEKPYECDICHARFTQSNSLKAHKLIHSVGEKPVFQCELCPTTCGRKTDLRIHVQKLHTSDKPLKCKRCSQLFPDRYSYKVHSKTHEGEKCYKCELCPYASISARHLESHILIHTDEKPYSCNNCHQSFRQKQLLKRHVNLYHNKDYVPPKPKAKTHVCSRCSRSFRHKGNLIRHMALHDPESKVHEETMALKAGRKKKIQIVNGLPLEVVGSYEDEDDDMNEDEEYMQPEILESDFDENETKAVKEEKENIVSVETKDGRQYVVLEVIQIDDAEDVAQSIEQSEENSQSNYDFTEIPNEVLETLCSSKKLRQEPQKMLGDDKDMESCFGFDEEDVYGEYDQDEDERRQKSKIRLFDIDDS